MKIEDLKPENTIFTEDFKDDSANLRVKLDFKTPRVASTSFAMLVEVIFKNRELRGVAEALDREYNRSGDDSFVGSLDICSKKLNKISSNIDILEKDRGNWSF